MLSLRYRFFIRHLDTHTCVELWGKVCARNGDQRLVFQLVVVTPLAVSEILKVA